MLTLPNILTLVRIALIPCFAVCYHLPFARAPIAAAAIFGIAALTDWADGFLARRLNQTSRFGAFLDPVADKLMVVVVLVILLQAQPSLWLALPVAVIIGRDEKQVAEKLELAKLMIGGFVDIETMTVVGTPDQVTESLLAKTRGGVTDFTVLFGDFGEPDSLELFSEQVVPALREGFASS